MLLTRMAALSFAALHSERAVRASRRAWRAKQRKESAKLRESASYDEPRKLAERRQRTYGGCLEGYTLDRRQFKSVSDDGVVRQGRHAGRMAVVL